MVTLRGSPDIRPRAEAFFGPFTAHMAEAMSQCSPQDIERFEALLGDLRRTMDGLLADEYLDGRPLHDHPG
ncbi:hypothetical protein [Streptomyces atroolivaceus]|uniref:hypothetical protein n=1 Tax=Streptomyces atroolivaceus TaxID=66869 RepID=UPI0036A1ABF1